MPSSDKDKIRAYRKEWYSKNKAKRLEANKRCRAAIVEMVRNAKEASTCKDCGVSYPWYVMQFDHLRDKSFNVAHGAVRVGKRLVQEEMNKCELVCANCHSVRTYKRRIEGQNG